MATVLNPQPALRSRDQFGNDSRRVAGQPERNPHAQRRHRDAARLHKYDIGTSAGNGLVTFTNIQVSAAGSGKQITASAPAMTNVISASFTINQATVTGQRYCQ